MSNIRLSVIKLAHYEFWPFWLFYLPMYFYGIYLAFRAGSATYFTAVNPAMKYGGAFDMSKFKLLESIPSEYRPWTILLRSGSNACDAERQMKDAGLSFPVIAKPDVGERGKNVKRIGSAADLEVYLSAHNFDIIIPVHHDIIPAVTSPTFFMKINYIIHLKI